jgi:hypothetical protein
VFGGARSRSDGVEEFGKNAAARDPFTRAVGVVNDMLSLVFPAPDSSPGQ